MSKARTPTGSAPRDDDDAREGIDQPPIRKQSDGSYHVGDRGGPLGAGATPWEAFYDYALNVRAYHNGEDVPISKMPYHGTLKRPVNYLMLESERLPDGSWHIETPSEVCGVLTGWGTTKDEARIHLAQLACDVATPESDD